MALMHWHKVLEITIKDLALIWKLSWQQSLTCNCMPLTRNLSEFATYHVTYLIMVQLFLKAMPAYAHVNEIEE